MGKCKQGRNLASDLTMKYLYTGRKEIDQEFLKEIKKIDEEILREEEITPYHIINNYGIGGIGKSSIQRHLIDQIISEENAKRNNTIKCIELDFDKKTDNSSFFSTTDERTIILEIIKRMENKYNINTFVCTLCALYKQSMVTGENNILSLIKDLNKKKEGKKTKLAVAFSKMIPGFGSIIELLKEVDGIVNNPENMSDEDVLNMFEKVASRISEESHGNVLNIKNSDSQEIDEKLMMYFAQDLRMIIQSQKAPFVFFIDTYENEINIFENIDENLQGKEKWLKYLISELPYVLWVIAGRENLIITNDKEWENITASTENNEVIQFTDDEVKEYMRRAKIPTALDSLFIKLSGGIPYILNILRQIYEDLDAKKENIYDEKQYILEAEEDCIEQNQNKKNDVIRRYLKRMDVGKDNKTSNILKQLSVINGGWTDDILKELSVYIKDFDDSKYEDLIRTTIIKESNGVYTIPEPIRRIMRSGLDANTRENVRKGISEVYKKKIIEDTNSLLGIENIFRFIDNSTDEEKESFYIETVVYIIDKLLFSFRIRETIHLLDVFNPLFGNSMNNEFKALYCHSLGYYYQTIGVKDYALINYKAAYKMFLDLYSVNNIHTICAGLNLASCLTFFGLYEESLQVNEDYLETIKDLLPSDHQYIIITQNNIADALRHLGKYDRALEVDEECYKKRLNSLSKTHLDTLSSQHNISLDYFGLGEYNKSLQIAEDCFSIIGTNSLQNQPIAAKVLSLIGSNLLKIGKINEALDKYLECHEINMKLFPIYSSEYASSLNNIAVSYRALGKYKEALDIDNECYNIRNHMYGEDHAETLDSLNNIACDYYYLMDYNKALETHNKCYVFRENKLTENHQDVLISLRNIGDCLSSMGDTEEALKKYEKSYTHLCDLLHLFHPEVINTLKRIINCLRIMGKQNEAIRYCESFCDTLERDYPKYVKKMDPILDILSMLYLSVGRKKEAEEISKKRVEISYMNDSDNNNNEEELTKLDDVATVQCLSGNYLEAINYWEKVLSLNERSNVFDEDRTIKIQFNIALCFQKLGQYQRALEWHTMCFKKSYDKQGIEDSFSLQILSNIAFCQKKIGMIDEALQNYKMCYLYRKKVLSETDEKTVETLKTYIDCLMETERYGDAYLLLKDLYNIQKQNLTDKNPETLETLSSISSVLCFLGNYQESEKVASYCFSELCHLLSRDDKRTVNSMYYLATAKLKLCKYSEAYDLFLECYNSSGKYYSENEYFRVTMLCNLGFCCVFLNRNDEALDYLERSYNLMSNIRPNNDPSLLMVLYYYAETLRKLGRHEEAQKNFDIYNNLSK